MQPILAGSYIEAKDHISDKFQGVIVSDVSMPGKDGFALLDYAQKIDAELPVILLSGQGDIPMAVRSVGKGAFDFLEKPFQDNALVDKIEAARQAVAARVIRGPASDLRSLGVRRPEPFDFARIGAHALIVADDADFSAHPLGNEGSGLADRNLEIASDIDRRAQRPVGLGDCAEAADRVGDVIEVASGLGRAQADLASGLADAISFGRPFLANPDLVDRLREGAPLTQAQMATFYSQGAEGYTDYPTLAEEKAAA
mgnify:CR=1 FL=1